jgi:RimJ/RimL family protein N-acetyltransferase
VSFTIISTPRLRLDPWSGQHTGLLRRLTADSRVMRFIGDGRTWPAETSDQLSAICRAHWDKHGFGWRAAAERSSGELVGFMALNYAGEGINTLNDHVGPSDPAVPHLAATDHVLGWWLLPSAWGQGFAREGAQAMCEEAFGDLRAPGVAAQIQPGNQASVAVARAVGLTFRFQTTSLGGRLVDVYWRSPATPAGP